MWQPKGKAHHQTLNVHLQLRWHLYLRAGWPHTINRRWSGFCRHYVPCLHFRLGIQTALRRLPRSLTVHHYLTRTTPKHQRLALLSHQLVTLNLSNLLAVSNA